MTDAERSELAMLRAIPQVEFTRQQNARAVALLRDGRRLAHDISAAAAAKRNGKGRKKKAPAVAAPAPEAS